MFNKPILSIIVPVYNVEKYLERCISSILRQKFTKFEVLLINDGSTDKSGTICDELANLDDRIRVVHKINQGVSSARNVGLSEANGEYIGFIDSDDWVDPNFYDDIFSKMIEVNADIGCSGYVRNYQGEEYMVLEKSGELILDSAEACKKIFSLKNHFFTWVLVDKVFKKKLFDGYSFDKNIKVCEDQLMLFELLIKSEKFVFIPSYAYHYEVREDSVTQRHCIEDNVTALIAAKKILEKAILVDKEFEDIVKAHYIINQIRIARKMLEENSKLYYREICNIQKNVRKDIVFSLLNHLLNFRQKLGVIYLCLPMTICVMLKKITHKKPAKISI